ncbi:MAG TPA: iron ABC transporter permease [Reyranella sp.]|jgi:iron(III) transport system permease protein
MSQVSISGSPSRSRRRWFNADALVSSSTLIISLVLVLAPLGFLLYASFRTGSVGDPAATFTLDNWLNAYGAPTVRGALWNTVLLSGSVAVVSIVVGFMLAWIVARTNAPGRERFAILLIVPLMISDLVKTLAWIALLAPNAGFINAAGKALFGVRTLFNIYSFQGMALVLVLHYVSFAFVPIYAALKTIDGRLEEASYMLGAGPVRTAYQMTIRLIVPTLASTFLLIFIFVAENFPVPTVLGANSGYQTLASLIYTQMQVEPTNPPFAAAIGTMLLWIALLGTFWQRRIADQGSRYVTVAGKGGQARITDLGGWKWLATALLGLYVAIAVVLPYLALLAASFMRYVTPRFTPQLFTLDNYTRMARTDYLLTFRNSLLLAFIAGLVATVIYVFMAYVIRRTRGRVGAVLDYVALAPTVTPALVLAMGFVWTYIWVPLPIYGTIWILVLAYLTRYYGYGVRQARAALVQISEELSEAARMSGASPLRAFRDVVLPALRPAVLSIWTMIFIFFFMELSMTILLYNPETRTLPVLLWESLGAGNFTAAFAIAVVVSTTIFVVIFVMNRFLGILRSSVDAGP